MAANPRKFSEKIALMRAKEAEGDAAFHQILTEVSGITKTTETVRYARYAYWELQFGYVTFITITSTILSPSVKIITFTRKETSLLLK